MKTNNLFMKLGLLAAIIAVVGCLTTVNAQEFGGKKVFKRKVHENPPNESVIIDGKEWKFRRIESVHDLLAPRALGSEVINGRIIGPLEKKVGFSIQNKKPEKIFQNITFNNDSPYINSESIDNRSVFEAKSNGDMPYQFYNAKYFTNYGVFRVRNNFDFRTYETYENFLGEIDVEPKTAKVFENKQGGIVESRALEIVNSYVKIHAENLKNQGRIMGANSTFIELAGDDVDLKNGIVAISGSKTYDFFNDSSGNGLYWGYQGAYQGYRLYYNGTSYGGGYPAPPVPIIKPIRYIFTPQYGVINVYSGVLENIGGALGWAFVSPDSGGYATVAGFPTAVIEIGSKYPILGTYGEPYGGEYRWLVSPGGSQFTPFIWSDFYLTGDNEYTHNVQAVFVRNTGAQDDIIYEAKIFEGGVSYDTGADDLENWSYGSPVVEFKTSKPLTNIVEGTGQINSFYVIDETSSHEAKWNFGITNIFSIPVTEYQQPDSFTFTRYTPREFQEGIEPNSSIGVDDLFYWESIQGAGEGLRTAAGVRITNILSRVETDELSFMERSAVGSTNIITQPMLSAGMITNFPWYGRSETPLPELEGVGVLDQPGSIRIIADELDLTQTRIRAEGGVTLETEHLIGTSNLVVDCQNIILRLGRRTGDLVITNVVPDEVERFTGSVEVHSYAWNQGVDIPDGANVKSKYYATFVDGNFHVTNRVIVPEMRLKSPEKIIIGDPIEVTDKLKILSDELLIYKKFKLGFDGKGQIDWNSEVAPKLLSLRNFGNLQVPNTQYFGNDREVRYENWINMGTNSAYVTKIRSRNFVNEGIMTALQNITVEADNIKIQNGYTESRDVMVLQGLNGKIRNQTNIVHGKFSVDIVDQLTDGGADADSYIRLWNDMEMVSLPKKSDLLGTTIHMISTNYANRVLSWPAKDWGAAERGYNDNLALGSLVVTNGFRGMITFVGKEDEKNAIYVDYLRFEGRNEGDLYEKDSLVDSFPEIRISDNFVVYFASSNLPEEKLDGMYGGRLRWVKEYPGHQSSMPLYLLGLNKTVQVNTAYRQSLEYDTDGDQIFNGFDLTPFGAGIPKLIDLKTSEKGTGSISMEWLAIPDTAYLVEYKSDLGEDRWKTLSRVNYRDRSVRRYHYKDALGRKKKHRFYRLRIVE
ncbi:MAG: hypothetical protein CL885_02665 [Dehalococcoidia bacterium]|nr:hypothetical protein [Dehalococcoidia bacterium]